MRRINQEALYYLRLAGHRSLELLTLQNMSMQAEYLNRPSEALTIVQSGLETDRLSHAWTPCSWPVAPMPWPNSNNELRRCAPSRRPVRFTSTTPVTLTLLGNVGR